MPWRRMKALEKALELSSWAAALVGPKMRRPLARNSSTTPAASGASGPTTVSAIFSACAHTRSSRTSVMATFSSLEFSAVPPLPGATYTLVTLGDSLSFHAIACSRPPPPITSTFIGTFGEPCSQRWLLGGVRGNISRKTSQRKKKAAVHRRNVTGQRCGRPPGYRPGLPAHPAAATGAPRRRRYVRGCLKAEGSRPPLQASGLRLPGHSSRLQSRRGRSAPLLRRRRRSPRLRPPPPAPLPSPCLRWCPVQRSTGHSA